MVSAKLENAKSPGIATIWVCIFMMLHFVFGAVQESVVRSPTKSAGAWVERSRSLVFVDRHQRVPDDERIRASEPFGRLRWMVSINFLASPICIRDPMKKFWPVAALSSMKIRLQ